MEAMGQRPHGQIFVGGGTTQAFDPDECFATAQ